MRVYLLKARQIKKGSVVVMCEFGSICMLEVSCKEATMVGI